MATLSEAFPLELVVSIAILAIVIGVGARWIAKFRAEPIQQEPTAGEMLTKFREMHSRGVLSDVEFRTIKTTLATHFQEELKDNAEKG
jgi:hypothetical protein